MITLPEPNPNFPDHLPDDYREFAVSQAEVLDLILRGTPMPELLRLVALRIESLCPEGARCSILLVNSEGTHLVSGAAPNLPDELNRTTDPLPIAEGIGSCGTSAARGEIVAIEDITTHPDWASLHDIVRRHGLRSCWSVPVFSCDRRVLGTMGIYHPVKRLPGPDEMLWVGAAAKLVSLAIERSLQEERFRESERLLCIAGRTARLGGWKVELPGQRMVWSDEVCAIHDVPTGTSPTLEEMLDLYSEDSRPVLRSAFQACLLHGVPFHEDLQIVTAAGGSVLVRMTGEAVRNSRGRIVRLQGALQDITDRKNSERSRQEAEARYLRQRNSLISLTGEPPPGPDDLLAAFRRITRTHSRTLGVARVSIWRYNKDRSHIRCVDLYFLDEDRHASGMELSVESHPSYFQALAEMDVVAVTDAATDPRTREFARSYLEPNGITSMLDASIHLGGVVDGVLCCEHVGPPREWTGDEMTFAAAVANLVSLALESGERHRAEREMKANRERFELLARATNDAVWDWDLETSQLWWSEGLEILFGYNRDEIEKTADWRISRLHPDERERVVDGIRASMTRGDEQWTDEYRFQRKDGGFAYVLDRGFVIRDANGKAIRMVGGMTDLTRHRQIERELARTNRALKMLGDCHEALIRATDEEQLLGEICRLAVEAGGYRMAWVGYARDDEEKTVEPMAWAGAELGYLEMVKLSWNENDPRGQGPAGRSIREGEAVVCPDIHNSTSVFHWLEEATGRGYRSVVCLPLRDGTRTFGMLGLYSAEGGGPVEEIELLQRLADNLAFGIGNIRARRQRTRVEEVVLRVAQAVTSGTGGEFFDLLTLNMVAALEARGGLIGRLVPGGRAVETLSLVFDGKRMENVTYTLVGTPCESVSEGEVCVFDRDVQRLFPEDHLLADYGVESYAGIPLFDRSGTVAGIMVVFFSIPLQDASLVQSTLQIFAARAASEMDRQQAEERIREQASLLDKARDAILVRDLDHRVMYWNKSAERLYGWTVEEAVGRSVEELLYRDTRAFHEACAQVVLAGEWVGELIQYDRHGRELVVEGRWTLLRDAMNQPASILAINTDITEHKQLEQQFLRSQRLESIGTLAGGIAHDLNNVLAPISMSLELLRADVHTERGKELLDTLEASARRGAEMVSQVLSFARGMAGRREEVQFKHLVNDVDRIVRDTFPKNIILETRVARNLRTLHADPTQLHQVLINLCVNARDAMPGGGRIRLTVDNVDLDTTQAASDPEARPGPFLRVEVEDQGCGIPQPTIDKIFEPFFTTKEVGKGTGLGLSTSMAIVKSHGGWIRVFSDGKSGSLFRVFLPAHPGSEKIPELPSHPSPPRGSGEVVLVVDDEAAIRQVAARILESFGYRVKLAADGIEALTTYREDPGGIDLVLTDMMMPGMDGATTIRALAEINPEIRVVAVSGITSHGEAALELGGCVKAFLPKPFTAESLLETLGAALDSCV